MAAIELKSKKFGGDKDQLIEYLCDLIIQCRKGMDMVPFSVAIPKTMDYLQEYLFYVLTAEQIQQFVIDLFESRKDHYLKQMQLEQQQIKDGNLN